MISFQLHFEKALSPFKRRSFKLYFCPPVSKNKFYNTISEDFPTLPHGILWLDVCWMIFFDLCEVILHIPCSARTLCRRLYMFLDIFGKTCVQATRNWQIWSQSQVAVSESAIEAPTFNSLWSLNIGICMPDSWYTCTVRSLSWIDGKSVKNSRMYMIL